MFIHRLLKEADREVSVLVDPSVELVAISFRDCVVSVDVRRRAFALRSGVVVRLFRVLKS